MINIESTVFNAIATELRSQYDGISVYGEYVQAPESFPCVCIVEDNNYTPSALQTNTDLEGYANVNYTITIYTNNTDGIGKKALGKQIADKVNDIMVGFRFRRIQYTQAPNIDRTIYRMVLRYQGIVKKTDYKEDFYVVFAR